MSDPKTQKMVITIETPADISEEDFSRLCDAALLRLLSASLEQRPVQLGNFLFDVRVDVARPAEVLPFEKDDPVMVKDFADDVWRRRYYSHSRDGTHYVFPHGTTSWSARSSLAFNVCRHPTPEELGDTDE